MDIKKFAEMLNGKEYGFLQFTEEEIQIAKDNGFVIVYGESDDLMEFDGAIYAEADCYDGGKIYFDETGAVLDEEFENSRCIEALWCDDKTKDKDGSLITWTYKTDIPHETFMILDDGESYCRGIVFDIKGLKIGKEIMADKITEHEALLRLQYMYDSDNSFMVGKRIEVEMAMEALEEIQQYRAIGTVQQCKEAVEKSQEKQLLPPKVSTFIYKGICPVCGNEILISEKYCSQCGQKVGR